MSLDKTGTDYLSYSYLESGSDYRSFELADELARVPGAKVPLSRQEEQRVERLVRDHIMISLHEHLSTFPAAISETPAYVRQGRTSTAFRGFKSSFP